MTYEPLKKGVAKTPPPFIEQFSCPTAAPSPFFISTIDYGYGQHPFSNLGDLTIVNTLLDLTWGNSPLDTDVRFAQLAALY